MFPDILKGPSHRAGRSRPWLMWQAVDQWALTPVHGWPGQRSCGYPNVAYRLLSQL